jgi:hypothetical protein
MAIGLYEFLLKVSKLKKTQEKVDAIRGQDSVPLRVILQCAFDPSVRFLLPEGEPPYKPNELVDQQHVLIKDCEKLRYFVQGFHDMLPQAKREMMFVELLERVDPDDAKLLCAIKDKKMPFPGITINHVTEALPGLIPVLEKKVDEQVSN